MNRATAASPVRLRRSRRRGAKLVSPNGLPIVCVTRPGKWGNPLKAGRLKGYTAADAVADYRRWLARDPVVRSFENCFGKPPTRAEIRRELGGKNLAC